MRSHCGVAVESVENTGSAGKNDSAALCEKVSEMKYATEFYPNNQYMGVHCEIRLPQIGFISSDKKTPEAEKLKEDLLAIPGVVEVTAYNYKLGVTRGGVFKWQEIEPQVLAVLREFFKVDELTPVPLFA